MARGKGEGTISKQPDGRWCARITTGYDENGKQLRRAFYGSTRKEAVAKMDAAKQEINRSHGRDFDDISVADWMDFWLEEYKKRTVGNATYHNMYNHLRLYVKPAFSGIKLHDLRSEMIQKFINDMVDQGYSRASLCNYLRPINGSLQQAVTNGLIRKNPALNIILPKKEVSEMRVLSVDEQARFVSAAKKYPIGRMFVLILATGLRIGEATALTWADIDFERKLLYVNKTVTKYHDGKAKTRVFEITRPKTEAGNRSIPLLPVIIEMLMKHRPAEYRDSDCVFTSSNPASKGQHVTNTEYWIKKIYREAGIEKGLLHHTLRHTFATRGLENGIELKVMQELLGHKSISITADTYTHVLPDKKKDSMMRLSDTIAMPSVADLLGPERKEAL